MSARSRLLTKDEELGKRDDDWKPQHSRSSSMSPLLPWRWRKRRFLAAVAVIGLLYLGVRNIPTDLGPAGQGLRAEYVENPYSAAALSEPSGAPPRDEGAEEVGASKYYYNGVVRFYKLGESLHKVGQTMGTMLQNRNVLFAASSLKSAANLIPMACEMARIDRNFAHLAIFGRNPLSMDEILAINGVDKAECTVHFHDARGDYAEYSSDARAESATRGAMKHINDFVHPQAIIMDDSVKEDAFFTKAMRAMAKEFGKALIEVPSGKYEQFLWMTRLDAGSLSNWFRPTIEIVIQAPPGSSGGVVRLLKTLLNADYSGLKVPRLTIEMPSDVEQFLAQYLVNVNWPPSRKSPTESSTLSIRRRVSSARTSSEEASIRFVESFYPSNAHDHHLLILSPKVELSPLYLQYVHYHLLEYRYQQWQSPGTERMLGISLDVPTSTLDGKGQFLPPAIANMSYNNYPNAIDPREPSPFLYQAASSTASLIFGDKWATFHDFLSKRVQASHSGKTSKTEKLVSETEPAWVEFLLELMRAREWKMLHPASSLVTVHNELSSFPEEYARPPSDDHKATEAFTAAAHPEEEPYLLSAEPPTFAEHTEVDLSRNLMSLHQILPFNGELQDVHQLPHLSHSGSLISAWSLESEKEEYLHWFRATIGGCQGDSANRRRILPADGRTDDLFCLPGIEMKFADDGAEEPDIAERIAQAIVDSPVDNELSETTMKVPVDPAVLRAQPLDVAKNEAIVAAKVNDLS